jgi:hypothetical protein
MSDKLKQFIDDNREAFDSESPDPKLYNKLTQKFKTVNTGKIYPMKLYRRIAAVAAVIILSASLYFIFKKNNGIIPKGPENTVDAITFPDPVYAKQIDQYQQMIDLQQIELKKVENEHPDLYRQFSDDINQLDSAYRALKITLEKNPNTEMLLEAMIRNLQLQSELLNRQLLIIKEIKQKSKT